MAQDGLHARTVSWLEQLRPYQSAHRRDRMPFRPEVSALLVIDMQRYFLDGSSHAFVPMAADIADNIRRLIAAFRSMGRPVVFTRHALLDGEDPGVMGRWWNDVLRASDPMSEVDPDLGPGDDEVVRKTRYSAFVGTDLGARLERTGTEAVVVTGLMTHLCCETTAREAFVRDYEVFLVVDGTASDSEDLHVSSLKTLTDGFALPVTTEEVLRWSSV
jgi:isochorismate hydrolase